MKVKKVKRTSNKLSRRQNYKLARMDKKIQMGKHSGQTARAISRHQMAALVSGNLNTVNANSSKKVDANINVTPGSLAIVDTKPNQSQNKPSVSNDSTDILGWLN